MTSLIDYTVPFLIVLTMLVFFHELGHYLVARWNRVRVEVFSIGFGRELFGWNDRAGTRWKVSAIPLGGYVKMFGDADAASMPGDAIAEMTPAEKEVSFHHKRLLQRVAIVAAGPVANFILAILLGALVFSVRGQLFSPAEVSGVVADSAAAAAGVRPHDVIVRINGKPVVNREAVLRTMQLNVGAPVEVTLQRDGSPISLTITPRYFTDPNPKPGYDFSGYRLGIEFTGSTFVRRDPISALWYASLETWDNITTTMQVIGQTIAGDRPPGVGGIISIAGYSGDAAKGGVMSLLYFAAMISISLGLVNLFPIPVLDGGHLLFYAAEAIRGKPLGQRAQEYGFRLGLALVLTLMIFATWRDIQTWKIVAFIKGLVT